METLQVVFEAITGNIFYMILAIALIILIGYGLIKKLFKLGIVMAICLVVYIGYIAITEGYDGVEDKLDNIKEGFEKAKDDIEKQIIQNP